ncbi:hypothetical protein [Brevibacillus nitrificans]|uniref:hypothetical protein n=1 Tax=Brevibacillus nitrificans TaxID=651560 RepID=UPI00285B04E0|nr:hypothetical protein [Brevibacillus nitrificans]MDR7315626.1 hypothetical protein [Brevibacillus nitrificans]
MWAISGILSVVALIAWLEIPSLLRKGYRREVRAFLILLLLAAVLSIAKCLQIDMPNPIDWLLKLFSPLYKMVEQLL